MGKNLGYPTGDSDGLTPYGFYYVLTNTKDGARQSAFKAFLRPIRNRANLHVTKRSKVTKILIDPTTKTAYGVEYVKNNKKYTVRAKKEVILSAGSLNSPQLLMLSGVGPEEHLKEMGIPVIQNLKVGDNMQDHVSMAGLAFLVNDTVSIIESRFTSARYILDYWVRGEGPYTLPGGAEAVAFVSTKLNDDRRHPDMELVFGPGAFTGDTGGSLRACFNMNDSFYQQVYKPSVRGARRLQRGAGAPPTEKSSRGAVRLRSKNPFHWPLLYPNYFNERDLRTMVEGIKMEDQKEGSVGVIRRSEGITRDRVHLGWIRCLEGSWKKNRFGGSVTRGPPSGLRPIIM
ncbi:hypothetical protein GE061_007734 [Apolygus lucorum]|uniref:Glucose-methanol-choline oxidoreductase N-terminal domain-containing protein n=1 Tax=Apolygus lucorum TaxID=248454 RepID=A0A8S9WP60_APOLU|nr:hypothetical protein GE061_007734 [Apolygus lucorum]